MNGSHKPERGRWIGAGIYALFFLSGATGLIYEVAWIRLLNDVFGNTTYAVSAVLTAFMGGLAIGSYGAGRLLAFPERGLRLYALLEVGIALTALSTPALFGLLDGLYGWLYRELGLGLVGLTGARFFLALLVLGVPTALMGATLPVLAGVVARGQLHIGSPLGVLYGLNTLGAMAGTAGTGFVGILFLGVRGTIQFAAALNLLVAVGALLLGRLQSDSAEASVTPGPAPEPAGPLPRTGRLALGVFAASGFLALSYEVLWTRLLTFSLGATVDSFTVMLATVLFGIGFGSAVGSRLIAWGREPLTLLAVLQAIIGICAFASLPLLGHFDEIVFAVEEHLSVQSYAAETGRKFLLGFMVMLLPALAMGATFPAVAEIIGGARPRIGSLVGDMYALNTLGAIAGSALTGLAVVPLFGTRLGLLLASSASVALACLVVVRHPGLAPARKIALGAGGALVILAAVVAMPTDILFDLWNMNERGAKLVYAEEVVAGTVTVHRHRSPPVTVISTSGVNVAGTAYPLRTTQKLQGHIPLLLNPDARRVLQIGFGSGETSGAVLLYDIERLDLAEINPAVIPTSMRFFSEINHRPALDPRFGPIIMDGKNYLRMTDQRYDVIMNDSSYPGLSGSSSLYGREHFAAARERLAPGGLVSCWVPLDISPRRAKMVLHTFASVFPHMMVWLASNHENKHAILVGAVEPLTIDFSRFLARFTRFAQDDLRIIGLGDPYAMLDAFFLDERGVRALTEGSPVHSDDWPGLEFATQWAYRKPPVSWRANLDELILHRASVVPYVRVSPEQEAEVYAALDRYHQATSHVLEGWRRRAHGEDDVGSAYLKALEINPAHSGARFLLTRMARKRLAAPLKSADYRTHLESGHEFMRVRAFDKATAEYRAVVRIKPELVIAHNNLALAYHQIGRYNDAIAAYKEALRLRPGYETATYGLGRTYEAAGKTERALAAYREVVRLAPENYRAVGSAGQMLMRLNRPAEAKAMFERVLELHPGDPLATQLLAQLKAQP